MAVCLVVGVCKVSVEEIVLVLEGCCVVVDREFGLGEAIEVVEIVERNVLSFVVYGVNGQVERQGVVENVEVLDVR